ncbi:hypothetical protein L7F22_034429 [Adiantum nelumboides]|nr:hypothetical protein [Adiantum nelumboides]
MADPDYRSHQGGYSSLSPSSLPGSVPAAADMDAMLLPFQEGNLQTFPPSNARSKLLGSYPPNHEGEGKRPDTSDEAQGGLPQFLRVTTYQPYFNVDTEEVFQRVLQSFLLDRGQFISLTSHNPDLYGPFWICTTLVFVASACGNFGSYLSNHSSWQFEIGKALSSCGASMATRFLYSFLCRDSLLFLLVS